PPPLAPRGPFAAPSDPAPFGPRVRVPADEQRWVGRAAEREPLVPRLVDLLDGTGSGQFLAKELAGRLPGVGPRDALRAVLVSGQLEELLEIGHDAARVQRHEDDPKA